MGPLQAPETSKYLDHTESTLIITGHKRGQITWLRDALQTEPVTLRMPLRGKTNGKLGAVRSSGKVRAPSGKKER